MIVTPRNAILLWLLTTAVGFADESSFAWRAANECELIRSGDHIRIASLGNDPYFTTRDVPAVAGKMTLEFALRSKSQGGGQLFWGTKTDDQLAGGQSVKFHVTHNLLWHEYRVEFTADDPLTALRLDLCSAPGELELAGLRLVDEHGLAIREWQPRWTGEQPSGDVVIRAPAGSSEIEITTTSRLAGAIHSVKWQGHEFIDSHDHGRQLQSAASFGNGHPFHAECFNPTEAGSRLDGAGPRSSSRLLELRAEKASLQSLSQMAFWLAPWEESEGKPALNRESRSHHCLSKTVRIGYRDLPHVIDYQVTFRTPFDEQHNLAQFESLTGYMPVEFDRFHGFNAETGELEPLSAGPGEQRLPVVLATADGQFAMGVISPPPADARFQGPSYGRFSFREQGCMKWNCVYRRFASTPLEPGEFTFQHYVAIGDLNMVRDALRKLSVPAK